VIYKFGPAETFLLFSAALIVVAILAYIVTRNQQE
jgi:hypothetical protein